MDAVTDAVRKSAEIRKRYEHYGQNSGCNDCAVKHIRELLDVIDSLVKDRR